MSAWPAEPAAEQRLRDFLGLDEPWAERHAAWAEAAPAALRARFAGTVGHRVLCRQDRWECLCSFLISSNNNVKRIAQIVQRLRAELGTPLAVPDRE